MADPVIWGEPERLRSIGFVLAMAGASLLATRPLSTYGVNEKQRVVIAGVLAVSGYYSLDKYPQLTGLITVGSVFLAILIPVGLSIKFIRDIVSE